MTRCWTLFFFVVICFYNAVSSAKECTSQGRFPNDQKDSCAGYTICLFSGPNRFAQINLTCPNGFIFNHDLGQCTNDTGYQCQTDFNCTDIGHFPNPFDDFCNSYIACIEGFNNIMTARSIDCSESYIFNPNEGTCVSKTEFQCKEQASYIETVLESTENSGYVNSQKNNILVIISIVILLSTSLLM